MPSLLMPERWAHRRLFVIYGNTFGNVADERRFCERLDMTQPGDLLWVEVAAARDSRGRRASRGRRPSSRAARSRRSARGATSTSARAALHRGPSTSPARASTSGSPSRPPPTPTPAAPSRGSSIVIWKCRSRGRVFEILYSRRYQPDALVAYLGGTTRPFWPWRRRPRVAREGTERAGGVHFVVQRR